MDRGWSSPTDVAERRPSAVPLDALLALSNDGFFFVGSDAHVGSWSDGAAALSSLDAARALHKDVRDVFVGGEQIVAIPFDGTPRQVRIGIEDRDNVRWLRAIVIAIDGQTHGWFCSFGPERRYREIEQLKNEIVAAVSHELKTPIASIKAFATTLRDNPDTIAQQRDEFLRVIDEQADRLTRAVDDLLWASRVDADLMLKRRVSVGLDEVIDVAMLAMPFDQRAHPLLRHTAGVMLSGDPELLREIFFHLLQNAGKFSKAGTPIEVEGTADASCTRVAVRDRGIGISEDNAPYIFERFYRVENELTAEAGGSGLGLFIARALVRAHGGAISVESRLGEGSTFVVSLPVRAPA